MDFITIPIIVIVCSVFMSVVKLFTKAKENEAEILATLVPCFGAIIALILYFVHSDFTLEFSDPIVAITIGFISGQSALETKSTLDYIKSKSEIKDMIIEELQNDEVKEQILETMEPIINDIKDESNYTE